MTNDFKCPICGKYKFKFEGDVCRVCGWEYDILQQDDHDYNGGANWNSVNQARRSYKKYGEIMTPEEEKEEMEFWDKFNDELDKI